MDIFNPDETSRQYCTKEERLKASLIQDLAKLGFGSGFKIPFISPKLTALQEKLERQVQVNTDLKSTIRNNRIHRDILEENITHMMYELDCYKSINEAARRECKSAEVMTSLEERATSSTSRDIARAKRTLMEYCERNGSREEALMQTQERVNALSLGHEVNKADMEYFEQQLLALEDFNGKLDYYKGLDEHTILDFEERHREAVSANRNLRVELDVEAMNTDKFHELYNRMTTEFRKSYRQRRDIISWWTRSAEQMKVRDEEIRDVTDEFFQNRETCAQLRSKLRDTEEQLMLQAEADMVLNKQRSDLDRTVEILRGRIHKAQETLRMLDEELLNHNIEIHQIGAVTKVAKLKLKTSSGSDESLLDKDNKMAEIVANLRNELHDKRASVENNAENLTRLEDLAESEYQRHAELEKQVYQMRQYLWERCLDKDQINVEEQKLIDRSQRLKTQVNILRAKSLAYTDKVSERQGKQYRLELDLSTLETKIIKLTVAAVDPRLTVLLEQRTEVQETAYYYMSQAEFLEKEIVKIKDAIDTVHLEIKRGRQRQFDLEQQLESDRKEEIRILKVQEDAKRDYMNAMAERNIMKLILSREKRRHDTGSSAKMKKSLRLTTLKAVAKERCAQIIQHKRLVAKELMEARKVLQKYKNSLTQVQGTVQHLVTRFQLSLRHQAPSLELDKKKALIGSFIKQIRLMSREKEMLAVEWKKWDSRLKETEEENIGFNNAIFVMDVQNTNYKNNLSVAQMGTKEHEAYEEALLNERKALMMKRRCDKIKAHFEKKEKAVKKTLHHAQKIVDHEALKRDKSRRELSAMQVQVARQAEKLRNWNHLLARMQRLVESRIDGD